MMEEIGQDGVMEEARKQALEEAKLTEDLAQTVDELLEKTLGQRTRFTFVLEGESGALHVLGNVGSENAFDMMALALQAYAKQQLGRLLRSPEAANNLPI